jgi:hypothetical protein
MNAMIFHLTYRERGVPFAVFPSRTGRGNSGCSARTFSNSSGLVRPKSCLTSVMVSITLPG